MTDIAEALSEATMAAEAALAVSLGHAIAAGDALIEAKETLGRDAFRPWVDEYCDFDRRTAEEYMDLARLVRERGWTTTELARQMIILEEALQPIDWELTPLMRAVVGALERLQGVATESDLSTAAAAFGENGRYGAGAHFAKGIRELRDRGILTTVVVGRPLWCFTDLAWRDRGHSGSAPRPVQEGLF